MNAKYKMYGDGIWKGLYWKYPDLPNLAELVNAAQEKFPGVVFHELNVRPGEDGEYVFLWPIHGFSGKNDPDYLKAGDRIPAVRS